jgi:hypothetical protein
LAIELKPLLEDHEVRLQERINSPLQLHKVHVRGLGGPTVCGVPRTGASATGGLPDEIHPIEKPRAVCGAFRFPAADSSTHLIRPTPLPTAT